MSDSKPSDFSHNYASLTSLRSESQCMIGFFPPTPETFEESTCKRQEDIPGLWARAAWPLVGHFIFMVGITVLLFFYIDNHLFNISSRTPSVEVDGSISYLPFRPLQSDISTVLSLALTLMRTAAGMWTAATTWRCVFILMEETGISLRAIDWMTTYRLPAKNKTWQGVAVAIILLAAFPAQYSSPIVAGSITWELASDLVQSGQPVNVSFSEDGDGWKGYKKWLGDSIPETLLAATGIASISWNNSFENTVTMKRVLPNTHNLPINSVLRNVTVPYFIVDVFEWIKDPTSDVSAHDKLALGLQNHPYRGMLTMGLIPDGAWGPSSNTTFPSPTIINETRTLAILYHQGTANVSCDSLRSGSLGYFGGLPEDVNLYSYNYQASDSNRTYIFRCMAFAQVTYTAGAAVCHDCRFSALTVVQNDTPVAVEPDTMTAEALSMMPSLLTSTKVAGISILPSSNIIDYVMHVFPRSYGAAWTTLTNDFASSATLTTSAMVPLSMSRARVLYWRVYLWLGLNILLTLSAVPFAFVQKRCQKPLVVNATIAALLMDTSRVLANDQQGLCDLSLLTEEDSKIGPLRLQEEHGHRFVNVEK